MLKPTQDPAVFFDVVIVGAGIVGLTAAKLLSQQLPDRSIALVESRDLHSIPAISVNSAIPDVASKPSPPSASLSPLSSPLPSSSSCDQDDSNDNAYSVHDFQPRVSALTLATEALFRHMGCWSEIEQAATPFEKMSVREYDGTGDVEFDGFDVGEPYMGHVVENRVIEQVLIAQLQSSQEQSMGESKVVCYAPYRLTSVVRDAESGKSANSPAPTGASGVQLLLNNERDQLTCTLHTTLLLVADGGQSPTREQLGVPVTAWDYGATSIVTTVKCAKAHGGVARQVFTQQGPLAFLPVGRDRQSPFVSIVWSLQRERADEVMALDDPAFMHQLTMTTQEWLGRVEACAVRHAFPLKQRHAQCYTLPGIAMVGDAAHTIHPLAGQGVNLGLMDVAVLIEELSRADRKGVALGDHRTLRRYERRRKGDNLSMMAAIELFKRLFETRSGSLRVLRNRGMSWFNQAPSIKRRVMLHAMGRSGDLPGFVQKVLSI